MPGRHAADRLGAHAEDFGHFRQGEEARQLTSLPDVLRATVTRLKVLESGDQPEVARAALYHLYRLVREAGAR